MRPTRTPELPLHSSSPKRSNIAKLNHAFEKGLDMAGLKKTKTGSGDKDRAYIIRQNTMLKVTLCTIVIFCIINIILFSTILKISIVRRDAIHAEAIHRSTEHSAQMKLMNVHMQLQKALDSEVHEDLRIEEFRSYIERVLGDTSNAVKNLLVKFTEATAKQRIEEVEQLLSRQADEVLGRLNILVHQFHTKAAVAKSHLKKLSEVIMKDIETEDINRDAFRHRMEELGEDPDFDYHLEAEKDGLHLEDDYADTARIEVEVEQFYHKLKSFNFPLVDSKVIGEWEAFLNNVIDSLDDEEKETDLDKVKNYINSQLMQHAPGVKAYDDSMEQTSVIDFMEDKIYEAKMAPHKQELLDMYTGWKEGKLNVVQVLGNLEKVANDENLYLIYDWLNGDLDHSYYEETKEVTDDKAKK